MRFMRMSALVALAVLAVAVPTALALAFNDSSYNQPQGVVGTPYSFTFSARGGCPPYHYAVINGALPPGLSLGTDTGTISGTPTSAGSFSYWVDLYDTGPPTHATCTVSHAQRQFTINIIGAMRIQQASLPSGVVGEGYSQQLTVDQGVTATWSVTSGNLPDGLTLSSTGLISGTPTAVSTTNFTVTAKDTSNSRTATMNYWLNVIAPLALTAPAVPQAEVGMLTPITMTPQATGGLTTSTNPYKWSISPETLPVGLTFDPATGTISGKPTLAGTFPITLTVTDNEGRTQSVALNLVVAPKLAISRTQHIGPTKLNKAYNVKLKVEGGIGALQFRLAAGVLPRGVSLDPLTGTLSGKPTKAGRTRFIVQVMDSLGVHAVRGYLLIVKGPVVKHKKHKKK